MLHGSGKDSRSLFQAQVRQDLGIRFLHCQQIVAGGAIVRNRLPVRAGVAPVVTTEAAGEIGVPEVVRMHAPVHLHRGENIA